MYAHPRATSTQHRLCFRRHGSRPRSRLFGWTIVGSCIDDDYLSATPARRCPAIVCVPDGLLT